MRNGSRWVDCREHHPEEMLFKNCSHYTRLGQHGENRSSKRQRHLGPLFQCGEPDSSHYRSNQHQDFRSHGPRQPYRENWSLDLANGPAMDTLPMKKRVVLHIYISVPKCKYLNLNIAVDRLNVFFPLHWIIIPLDLTTIVVGIGMLKFNDTPIHNPNCTVKHVDWN